MNKILSIILLSTIPVTISFACGNNEYEQCWSLGPYKDCKCFPKVGGTIGQIGEESKRITNNIISEVSKTPEAINNCLRDTKKCVIEIISAPLALPVQAYIDDLYRQSSGRASHFSPEFVALAQPYFSVDISKITYANDINTRMNMSVSYCDRIFFIGHGNLWIDKGELFHVLHELEHTVQCQKRGKSTYLAEYVLKAGTDVLKTGTFNVHDIHDYEVAANNKANYVTEILWQKIQSGAVPIPRGNNPGNLPPPPPPTMPLRYCATATFTCNLPPTMLPMGTSCNCNGIPGSAF